MKVLYEIEGGTGVITLSAPPRNALTHPVFTDRAELARFLLRPELRAVILRGEGRHFCGGADLASIPRLVAEPASFARALAEARELLDLLSFATVPVLALIRGACLGAGLEIALSCHFRIASQNALLGLPEAGVGLMPGLGGTLLAQEVAGRRVAIELALSGKAVGAAEAASLGLVDAVYPTAELDAQANRFLRSLVADRPAQVVRAIMEAIHNARRLPRAEALRAEARMFLELARSSAPPGPP
jgi:enoyl-CoA hydratase